LGHDGLLPNVVYDAGGINNPIFTQQIVGFFNGSVGYVEFITDFPDRGSLSPGTMSLFSMPSTIEL
jgi:hypothetical protein